MTLLRQQLTSSKFSRVQVLAVLFLALLLVVLFALSLGAIFIPWQDILLGHLHNGQQAVLFSIRLPRILLAVIVGMSLAVSGAAMQGLFRNPLADPSLIGISSGAALSVAIFIVILGPISDTFGLYSLSIFAFLGGVFSSVLVFRFAHLSNTFSVTYMLLAGIAINALAAAGTGFLTYLSDDQQLRMLTFWTMGSLGGALWPAVIVASSIILPAAFLLMRHSQQLNILLLGEKEAEYLGLNIKKLKYVLIICAAFSVGAAVALSGIIGFVGLIVPHLIRLTLGPDHRLLIPASAILGAILLLVADTAARTIVAPSEMPVGILTSLIGGPFFLWLLLKNYQEKFGS